MLVLSEPEMECCSGNGQDFNHPTSGVSIYNIFLRVGSYVKGKIPFPREQLRTLSLKLW